MRRERPPIQLGLIGCGWVTERWHVPALQGLPGIRVVAVADPLERHARRVAAKFGSTVCRHIDDLIDGADLDAVAVCVPPALHASVAQAAIAAGKSVFIEKPLSVSTHDVDMLIDQARGAGSPVLVGYNLRWHPGVLQLKTQLQAGTLGDVLMVRSVFTNSVYHDPALPSWRRRRAEGGGVLHDLAAHHADLWRFLFASEVVEVQASTRDGLGEDDAAALMARLANGVAIAATYSAATVDAHDIEIYGTRGHVRLSCYGPEGPVWQSLQASGHARRLALLRRGARAVPAAISALVGAGDMQASYRAQWQHFEACVRRTEPSRCTLDDGRRALEIVLAAMESAHSGQRTDPSRFRPEGVSYATAARA